ELSGGGCRPDGGALRPVCDPTPASPRLMAGLSRSANAGAIGGNASRAALARVGRAGSLGFLGGLWLGGVAINEILAAEGYEGRAPKTSLAPMMAGPEWPDPARYQWLITRHHNASNFRFLDGTRVALAGAALKGNIYASWGSSTPLHAGRPICGRLCRPRRNPNLFAGAARLGCASPAASDLGRIRNRRS